MGLAYSMHGCSMDTSFDGKETNYLEDTRSGLLKLIISSFSWCVFVYRARVRASASRNDCWYRDRRHSCSNCHCGCHSEVVSVCSGRFL